MATVAEEAMLTPEEREAFEEMKKTARNPDGTYTKEYLEIMEKLRSFSMETRKQYIDKLASGEMSVEGYMTLMNSREFRTLQGVKVLDVLQALPGWNHEKAVKTMLRAGIHVKTVMNRLNANGPLALYLKESLDMIITTKAKAWHRVPKIEKGWPWHGNVRVAIRELESIGTDIDKELMYFGFGEFEDDVETGKTKFKSSKNSDFFKDSPYINEEKPDDNIEDDGLSGLLSDEDEKEDDGLSSLLDDEDDSSDEENYNPYAEIDGDNDYKSLLG